MTHRRSVRIAVRSCDEWVIAYLTTEEDLSDAVEVGRIAKSWAGACPDLYADWLRIWEGVMAAVSEDGAARIEKPDGGSA